MIPTRRLDATFMGAHIVRVNTKSVLIYWGRLGSIGTIFPATQAPCREPELVILTLGALFEIMAPDSIASVTTKVRISLSWRTGMLRPGKRVPST